MRLVSLLVPPVLAAALLGCAVEGPAGVRSLGDLPNLRMADLTGLDDADWGPPAREEGRTYRPARAGRKARIVVPIWWGKGLRPPEGTVYVLKIAYRDTATEPVIFYSHAGVGSYWQPSEVHRFGGFADRRWKTAHVPVSWDLVIRKNAPGDITEFFLLADTDLPVESIVVAPAGEAAAERYFRETREWVARVQAEKRKNADLGAKQTAVLEPPASGKLPALVPYVRTYLATLMPNSAPQKGEAFRTLRLRMARNEYETAAFGIYANGRDLEAVNVSLDELAGPGGKLACEIDCRTAEYAAVVKNRHPKIKTYRMFPQRMWPAYPVDIPAGRSHWFWVTVKTLGGASRPGTYRGRIDITARTGGDRVRHRMPVEVEVVPVTLLTMRQAGLDQGSCVGGLCTLQELKTLFEFNHTGMDIWFGGAQPEMKVRDGKLVQDWYYLDNWMEYAVGTLGMTHVFWFLGGDPLGFPDTLNLERDLYRALEGDVHAGRRKFLERTNAKPHKVLPELRELYVEWVRQAAEHAREKRWPARIILHPFDEPNKWTSRQKWDNPYHPVVGAGPWIRSHFKDNCGLIRQGARGGSNILIGADVYSPSAGLVFLDDIDVFCTNAIAHDPKLGEKVRAGGKQFWQYGGCHDHASAYDARLPFGFYFSAYDSRGHLVWAYNTLPRLDTTVGSGWGFGWYTPFGTVHTPYMIGLREAYDDRRWVETYRKGVAAKAPAGGTLLEDISREAVAQRHERRPPKDFAEQMQRLRGPEQWRDRIIDAMIKR